MTLHPDLTAEQAVRVWAVEQVALCQGLLIPTEDPIALATRIEAFILGRSSEPKVGSAPVLQPSMHPSPSLGALAPSLSALDTETVAKPAAGEQPVAGEG